MTQGTSDRKKVDILVVEDNSSDAELTARALKNNNPADRLFIVKDGEEALEFLFSHGRYSDSSSRCCPKVIFLDLKLPGMRGADVLREIKVNEQTKMIPVVIMSSSADEKDIRECFLLGANSYIVKPVDFGKYMKTIQNAGSYWIMYNRTPSGK